MIHFYVEYSIVHVDYLMQVNNAYRWYHPYIFPLFQLMIISTLVLHICYYAYLNTSSMQGIS